MVCIAKGDEGSYEPDQTRRRPITDRADIAVSNQNDL